MTEKEFHEIITKPKAECNGCELHLKDLWNGNNAKSIFYVTGLDFTETFAGRPVTSGIQIKNPLTKNEECGIDKLTASIVKNVEKGLLQQRKKLSKNILHEISGTKNYTGGVCSKCKCLNFIQKPS